tara:strand:- start:3249 stop:3893 length:645 start_codon:yes stop_codon:yes gene_type:complete
LIDSKTLQIDKFLFTNVSRETLVELEDYSKEVITRNRTINLISKNTEKSFKIRHISDSAQTIDFIDKNDIKICTDIGSGAGLPGIVLGILMKSKKPLFKVIFYEKSYHKSVFIEKMSKKFNLNSEIHQKNIFNEKGLRTDVIISRAFKPLPIIFQIAQTNFKNFKYIIIFLGKRGREILNDALKYWKFDYEEKKSLTNDESFIVKISNLRKRNV